MKRLLLATFVLLPTGAFAQSSAAPQTPSTKVSMRIMVDLFRKNFTAAPQNLKQPQIGSFRLKIERDLGENSYADVELRPNETEYYYNYTTAPVSMNGFLYYFHLGYRTPIEGLQVAYVREKDPTVGGYLGEYSLTANFMPSLISHQNRIEAVRLSYENKEFSNLKVIYWLARDSKIATSLDAKGNNELTDSKGNNRNEYGYYHRVSAGMSMADFNFELGLGKQTHFLSGLGDDKAGVEGSNDMFYSLKAEYVGLEDTKILVGAAYDSYAAAKTDETDGTKSVSSNTMTTVVAAGQYSAIPKTLTLYAEYATHMIKTANKSLVDYSKDTLDPVNSMTEQSLVLGAQYFLDSKLSLVPQYAMYMNNRHASYRFSNGSVTYGTGSSAVGTREALMGSSKPVSSEHQLAMRVNYSY